MDVNIGKGLVLPVDTSKLPENALQHVIYIGLRNILMDAHAGVDKDEPDSQAKSLAVSEKKLAALMSGEVRVASTREGDPVKAEAIKIALAMVKTAIRKQGKKLSDYEPKALRDAAVKLVESKPEITEQAKANVEATKGLDVGEIEI